MLAEYSLSRLIRVLSSFGRRRTAEMIAAAFLSPAHGAPADSLRGP